MVKFGRHLEYLRSSAAISGYLVPYRDISAHAVAHDAAKFSPPNSLTNCAVVPAKVRSAQSSPD